MNNEVLKIGDRVLGKKGTKVEGLIGTIIGLSDVYDRPFVSFITPLDEVTRAKVEKTLNNPMCKNISNILSMGVTVESTDIFKLNDLLNSIKKKYDTYRIRYGFEHDNDKKSSLEVKIHIIHNTLMDISKAAINTGYFDHNNHDLKKILEDD